MVSASLRILVVGSRGAGASLAERLGGLGHTVCGAALPGQAVERAAALGPDLVLTDLDVDRGRAGVEAAARCGVPVVCLVCEGGAAGAVPLGGRLAVPAGFVVKPAGEAQLRLAVAAAISAQARERATADAEGRVAALQGRVTELQGRVTELEGRLAITETVFDALDQGVVALNTAGRILLDNAAGRRLIGDPALAADDSAALSDWRLFRMDGRTPVPPNELPLARARRGESSDAVELMLRRPGESRAGTCIRVAGRPLRDARRNLVGGVIVINDVTRIKRNESRLRRAVSGLRDQRQLMRAVLDTMHEGVAALGVNGKRLLINRAARGLVDLRLRPPDAPLDDYHMKRYDIRLPDGVTPYPLDELPLRRALRGERFVGVEMVIPHPDRPEGRHVIASGGPLLDRSGGVRAGVLVLADVTALRKGELDLKRTASKLREHSQLMDMVFHHLSDGVVVADDRGRFTLFNRSAERLVGIGATEGPTAEWTDRYGLFHPDQVTPFAEEDLPLVRAIRGESSDHVEIFVRNERMPEGSFISVDGRPLRDESGKVTGGVAVVRDLSQDIVAREAFVSGRLEVVDAVLHNIGNAMNSITVGTGTLHAEMRENELLGRLSALAEAVAAQGDDPIRWLRDDEQGRQALPFLLALAGDLAAQNARWLQTAARVRDRVRHVVDIIRTQKTLSGDRQEQKVVDLRRLFDEAVGVVGELLASRGIEVEVDCARAPDEIRTHESRFHQMLVNLITNAIEAIDERASGGGFGSGERPRIRVSSYLEAEFLMIDITDNGIGIDKGQLRSIFAAGYTTKATGSGLGLHSAANFVLASGGRIAPLSAGRGRGATMRVMLRRSAILVQRPASVSSSQG